MLVDTDSLFLDYELIPNLMGIVFHPLSINLGFVSHCSTGPPDPPRLQQRPAAVCLQLLPLALPASLLPALCRQLRGQGLRDALQIRRLRVIGPSRLQRRAVEESRRTEMCDLAREKG